MQVILGAISYLPNELCGRRLPAAASQPRFFPVSFIVALKWRSGGILQQLNKGEDRHKLARAVFHGKRGELRQRYHEGQEDQLGALGLVVNIIVLWNTLYINAALQQLEQEGFEIQSEDIARLSPLVFEHINVLGRYSFSLPEAVSRGELRPLRNAFDAFDEIT